MIVYIALYESGAYSDYMKTIIGVFSTVDKGKAAAQEVCASLDPTKWVTKGGETSQSANQSSWSRDDYRVIAYKLDVVEDID